MLTKSDIQTLRTVIREEIRAETKGYKHNFNNLENGLTNLENFFYKLESKYSNLENYFAEFKKEVKESILLFKDQILHEIVGLRDEVTIIVGYRDMLEDHENRITKVERKVGVN